jgi:large subunit ribosomal protein L11
MNKRILILELKVGDLKPGMELSSLNINMIKFCKIVNEKAKNENLVGNFLRVEVKIENKDNFEVQFRNPPTSYLIKKELGIEEEKDGKALKDKEIKIEQIKKIAKIKMEDLTTVDFEKAIKTVSGTVNSMGIKIIE